MNFFNLFLQKDYNPSRVCKHIGSWKLVFTQLWKLGRILNYLMCRIFQGQVVYLLMINTKIKMYFLLCEETKISHVWVTFLFKPI